MSIRTLASLAVAVLLGLLALLGVREILNTRRAAASAATMASTMTPVVVAALPIERGATLNGAMLKTVSYPKSAVPAGAFMAIAQVTATGERKALRSITINEPVLASKLSGPNAKSNLSGVLSPGMRAVSVRSSDVTGVGGFVLPGDHVDIHLTRSISQGQSSSTVTQVIAENALVVGVDQISDQETEKPVVSKSVTVEVSPEQASAIALGQSVGLVTLALRQLGDQQPLARHVMTVAELTALTPANTAPAVKTPAAAHRKPGPRHAPAASQQVNVIRGTEATNYSIGS